MTTTLDDFFTTPAEALHPRLRNWKERLQNGGESVAFQLYWPKSEFGQSQPEINLQFEKDGHPLPLETVQWDDDLNSGLVRLGVRAGSQEQEADRFALGLRGALRKAEREFGDGYFNAVLVELLRDSDLAQRGEISEVLKHAYSNSPHREGGAFDRYTICHDLITNAIKGRADELTDHLNYRKEDAKSILISAIARYLDERFSVSSRQRMGLL